MNSIVRSVLVAVLALHGSALADSINFTINTGYACPLEGQCLSPGDTFTDVEAFSFTGELADNGDLLISEDITLVFDGGNQSIVLSVIGGVLAGIIGTQPDMTSVPNANWHGMFAFTTSSGTSGVMELSPGSFFPGFFTDNNGTFIFSLLGDNNSAPINFSLEGTAQFAASEVPLPAAVWLFGSALIGLTRLPRRS